MARCGAVWGRRASKSSSDNTFGEGLPGGVTACAGPVCRRRAQMSGMRWGLEGDGVPPSHVAPARLHVTQHIWWQPLLLSAHHIVGPELKKPAVTWRGGCQAGDHRLSPGTILWAESAQRSPKTAPRPELTTSLNSSPLTPPSHPPQASIPPPSWIRSWVPHHWPGFSPSLSPATPPPC